MTEEVAIRTTDDNSQKMLTTIVYALQATSFLFGITFIVAVIINYVKKSDVSGTWLESHFRWQIRTFWFALLWSIIGIIGTFFLIGYLLLTANAIWVIYRIVKGWLRLNDRKEMYT
ncbi:Putative transmembrane protein [hydrothermal vent metagenome]|uniref:Transmembrane protein n=1 Tax=hydrothermal vent metagenome TaxID=652676 RepID=A0A3B0ZRR1_9ZZZZ